MSASTQASIGEKTKATVLKKVGKRPKTALVIAQQSGISEGAARRHLMAATKKGTVVQEKEGRAYVFRLPVDGKSMAEEMFP